MHARIININQQYNKHYHVTYIHKKLLKDIYTIEGFEKDADMAC